MKEIKNEYNILIGKYEGQRLLGRPRRKWENNTEVDIKEISREGVDWIYLA
jgi:hypothetical protein